MTVYTSMEGLKLGKNDVRSYKELNEDFIEWINKTTIDLLSKRNEAELKAGRFLKTMFNCVDEQPFFMINNHSYFLDYFIASEKLAIEIDGGYHKYTSKIDKQRDADFSNIGIRTIRINANKVLKEGITIFDFSVKHISRKEKKQKRKKDTSKTPNILRKAWKRLKEHDKMKNKARWI